MDTCVCVSELVLLMPKGWVQLSTWVILTYLCDLNLFLLEE